MNPSKGFQKIESDREFVRGVQPSGRASRSVEFVQHLPPRTIRYDDGTSNTVANFREESIIQRRSTRGDWRVQTVERSVRTGVRRTGGVHRVARYRRGFMESPTND